MSLSVKSVPIVTNGSGAASVTVRAGGIVLHRIDIEVGTLTTPDIDITDGDTTLLSVAGLAADASYRPLQVGQDDSGVDISGSAVAASVFDTIQIEVSGAGNAKTGRIRFLYDR